MTLFEFFDDAGMGYKRSPDFRSKFDFDIHLTHKDLPVIRALLNEYDYQIWLPEVREIFESHASEKFSDYLFQLHGLKAWEIIDYHEEGLNVKITYTQQYAKKPLIDSFSLNDEISRCIKYIFTSTVELVKSEFENLEGEAKVQYFGFVCLAIEDILSSISKHISRYKLFSSLFYEFVASFYDFTYNYEFYLHKIHCPNLIESYRRLGTAKKLSSDRVRYLEKAIRYEKAPVKGFQFVDADLSLAIKEKRLKKLFYSLKMEKYISEETEFKTFLNIFDNREIKEKVNWIREKNQLHYFIKTLLDNSEYMSKDNERNIWIKTTSSFLHRNNIIEVDQLQRTKQPTSLSKLDAIDDVIKTALSTI
ncbi:MAG: hypothetical protein ACI91R_002197 [Vicingaceae bacterium]|jgi:hypothetical protein